MRTSSPFAIVLLAALCAFGGGCVSTPSAHGSRLDITPTLPPFPPAF